MSKSNTVYLGQLDRFGYTLTVVGKTKSETENALLEAYKKAYEDFNGISPDKDYVSGSRTYLELAKEEMFITKLELGDVQWF